MKIDHAGLQRLSAETGFRPEVLEKVLHLLELLEGFRKHPFLKDRFVLKGGAALNAFIFRLPRLSADIDLNYVGESSAEKMKVERPKFEKAVKAVCARQGLEVQRTPDDYLGGKWVLRYASVLGGESNLKLDINFGYRVPFWNTPLRDSFELGDIRASQIPVLDIHELTAGKLTALVARDAARDVFDVWKLFEAHEFEMDRLRAGFVAYGAMSRKDWRTISVDDIDYDAGSLKNELLPFLRKAAEDSFTLEDCREMIDRSREVLEGLLPFTADEQTFLDRILDDGVIEADLLMVDSEFCRRLTEHPLLKWKALNVRKHKN